MATIVVGSCDPRFHEVREEFERNFAARGEVGASVCVIVEGETVVDLWGGVADPASDRAWERDTVGLVFSATKGATALCAHILADRGQLDLDAPVAAYWPEFAAHGKASVTARMLLSNRAGLPAVRSPIPPGGFCDWALMVELLAGETPFWQPGTRHGYHGFVFGWLVGELVRRVSGRSVGAFFREEVAEPLGLDFWIGLPEKIEPRVAPSIGFDPAGYRDPPPLIRAMAADPESLPALIFLNTGGWFSPAQWDTRASHAAEIPAAGGITNARGLAGMYAPLSRGGLPLVSDPAITPMRETASAGHDPSLLAQTCFSLGFAKSWDNRTLGPGMSAIIGEDAFGHPGAGGSIGFADPRARMAFGYTMNRHGPGIALNERGQSLVDAVYRTLGRTGGPG